MNIDLLQPPFNEESERTVLASIMRFCSLHDKVADMRDDLFYLPLNRAIFSAIKSAAPEIDLGTICRHARGQFTDGDVMLLNEYTVDAYMFNNHLEYLNELAERRSIMATAKDVAARAESEDIEILRNRLSTIIEKSAVNACTMNGTEIIDRYMNELQARARGERNGLSTGYKLLDEMINGLQPGGLYVVSGRTKMGKTQFAMNIADNMIMQGKRVYITSMEMKSNELMDILFSKYLQIDSKILKNKASELTDYEWSVIADTCAKMSNNNMILNDSNARNVKAIERDIVKHKPDIVIVDNLNLMSGNGKGKRYEIITELSCEVKRLAMEYNIPVLLIAHMNRDCDKRDDHHPIMSDLRDSGSVEQDANVIIFVYREGFYNYAMDQSRCEIVVAANRSGNCGVINFSANLATGTFKEA